MTETWKDIPGWEGVYQASTHGRIRSLDRDVPYSDGRVARRRGVVMSPRPDGNGYPALNLSRGNRHLAQCVHVLIARTFLGPPPEGREVRHWDDDKTNCALSNLIYGTRSDNVQDAIRNGRQASAKKTHCKAGHPLSGDNLRVVTRKDGRVERACRACGRARTASYAHRNARKAAA